MKPNVTEILYAEDGPLLMVRASTLPEAIAIAHEEAAGDDYVVCDPESVRLEWIRAMPCVPRSSGGHEIDGGWCEGGHRCHYLPGKPGRGAFSGAFVGITFAGDLEDDDPRKAPYLAACAEMEERAAARALTGGGGDEQ